jgi:hypothetical protein
MYNVHEYECRAWAIEIEIEQGLEIGKGIGKEERGPAASRWPSQACPARAAQPAHSYGGTVRFYTLSEALVFH